MNFMTVDQRTNLTTWPELTRWSSRS